MDRYVTMHGCADFWHRIVVGILCLTVGAGTVRGGEIYKSTDANGNVVYSDHLDSSTTQATTVHLDDAGLPPRELHFCWTNCFTLDFDNGVYRRVDGTEESWTVETFSAKAIVLHRHDPPVDWNGYSSDVVYAGQVANDRLVGVTVNGKPTSGIDASWGSALNTLPGNNAERDSMMTPSRDLSSGAVGTDAAPPPLVAEDQPPLPEDGLLWTPGYWNRRVQGYYWIPGCWVRPPQLGLLWTPAYWSAAGAVFILHPGHWGSTVGFYGGVNYGYGYFGSGFTGGHWIGNSFAYNTAVNHMNQAVAQHTYAESAANQASRSVLAHTVEPRGGAAAHAMSPQSPPRVSNNPEPAVAVRRTRETAAVPVPAKPTAVVKTQVPSAPAKLKRVTPTQAASR